MTDDKRQVTEHVASVMGTSEARLYEQVKTSFNWLLGTLFAANGGAVVALVNRDAGAAPLSLALFAAGIVCSILMGFLSAAYGAKAIVPTTEIRMTLALIAEGKASVEHLQEKTATLTRVTWMRWPMWGAGAVSFLCLISGMITFAFTPKAATAPSREPASQASAQSAPHSSKEIGSALNEVDPPSTWATRTSSQPPVR